MKRMIVAARPSLLVSGLESKVAKASFAFECSVTTIVGRPRIDRIRDESGRWISPATWLRRVRALGVVVNLDELEVVGPGPHSPIY